MVQKAREQESITVRHGRLRMEIPPDWADRSSLVFVSPSQNEVGVPLAGKKPNQYHNNINVNFEPKPDEVGTAEEYLKTISHSLRETGMEFQDFATTTLSMGPAQGACVERRLKLGDVWVRQLTAVTFIDGLMVVATASTAESMHKQELPRLRKLLESVRFE